MHIAATPPTHAASAPPYPGPVKCGRARRATGGGGGGGSDSRLAARAARAPADGGDEDAAADAADAADDAAGAEELDILAPPAELLGRACSPL